MKHPWNIIWLLLKPHSNQRQIFELELFSLFLFSSLRRSCLGLNIKRFSSAESFVFFFLKLFRKQQLSSSYFRTKQTHHMLHLTFTTWKTTFELFHIEVYSRNQTYKKISFSREFSGVNFYRISRKSSQPESLEHFHRGGCSPVICISRIANQKTGLLNICILGEFF